MRKEKESGSAEEIRYREVMNVEEIKVYQTGAGEIGYAVCPRCGITMEREYMNYCSRCGQRVGWKGYQKVRVIYPGKKGAASGKD